MCIRDRGYGLGASLGAKVGRTEKTVVNIAGDGCFRMNMNEIATATRHNIPVIQVVINNHVPVSYTHLIL